LGWKDPLSKVHIAAVARMFVLGRWGAQMLASKKNNMALLVPVRAKGSRVVTVKGKATTVVDELGPFGRDGAFAAKVLEKIAALTDGSFSPTPVEAFTFSSGILDLNPFLTAAASHMKIVAIYNCDPEPLRGAEKVDGAVRKEFTRHDPGFPGFESMPTDR